MNALSWANGKLSVSCKFFFVVNDLRGMLTSREKQFGHELHEVVDVLSEAGAFWDCLRITNDISL